MPESKETPQFSLSSVITPKDMQTYYSFLHVQKAVVWRTLGIAVFGAVLLGLLLRTRQIFLYFVYFAAIALLSILGTLLEIHLSSKKHFATGDQHLTYSFYADHFVLENEAVSAPATMEYAELYQGLLQKKFFILYPDSQTALLILRKDIPNEAAFLAFMKEKLGNRFQEV